MVTEESCCSLHLATFESPTQQAQGRCIALFPGAFRPPHAAHFAAVLDLVDRPEVDEVVIIIANRSRLLPGTSLAIDAHVACQVWSIYLRDVPKVRVEIARHDAISHAFGFFERSHIGDRLLFCIGEADFGRGDDRFTALQTLVERTGIDASVVPAPTATLTVRATEVRQSLTSAQGYATFMAALPHHLNNDERERVWSICRTGLRQMTEIVAEKLPTILDRQDVVDLASVGRNPVDPVFRLQLEEGQALFAKYAGDTIEEGVVGEAWSAKPRRRLGAERRAIRYLQDLALPHVELPEVIAFDKETQTLLLSEVCPGGESLQTQLEKAVFDVEIAAAVARFLAFCHTVSHPPKHLWGEAALDQRHWLSMLALRTVRIDPSLLVSAAEARQLSLALEYLYNESRQASRSAFFHLDTCPKNVRIAACPQRTPPRIGMIDFEFSSSIGDPACDVGCFIGHYLFWGICKSADAAAWWAVQTAVQCYQATAQGHWGSIANRAIAFAGATILRCMVEEKKSIPSYLHAELVATALRFLQQRRAGYEI